jgi:phosphoglycolate phosphatase
VELYEKFTYMNIFFDLDGTLIDSKLRLYSLFQKLVPESILTYDEYWKYKMNKISHYVILKQFFKFEETDIKIFETKWMQLIEDDYWLSFDKPFEGITEHLSSLNNSGFNLYLVTARQKKDKVVSQINSFGWTHFFKKILVTEQKYKKSDLIKPNLENSNYNWMVGDTGMDIIEGKRLNMQTVAVLTGFLSEKILNEYNPDKLVSSVLNFNPLKN